MTGMAKRKEKEESPTDEVDGGWVARSVRFPPELYSRLEEDAKKERRSTQLQIIWMIEEAYRNRDQAKPSE